MHKDLKWKIPLILLVVLGAAWLGWPLKEKIALGLDLQGGMQSGPGSGSGESGGVQPGTYGG